MRDPHPAFRNTEAESEASSSRDQTLSNADEEKAKIECSNIFLPGGGFAKLLLQKWYFIFCLRVKTKCINYCNTLIEERTITIIADNLSLLTTNTIH
jgi:hypothetical protein